MKLLNKNSMAGVTIAGLAVSVIAGFALNAAAAPVFNTFPISFTPQENRDLPMIDARNVTDGGSFSSSQADHDNGVQAGPGDVIEFQVYYHNVGTPEDVAHNVIIKANLPGGSRSVHEASATIDSDETSPISSNNNSRGGNIKIHINGGPQTLELISGSVRHFPNRSQNGIILTGGDNITTTGVNIGNIQGCFEFSGFVNFKARVGQVGEPPAEDRDLSISKRVLNVSQGETVFRNTTNANPGDRVRFEVRFSTSGDASQNNVIVRDILPNRLNRVSNTLRVDGVAVGGESDFFGSGRNFGTLSAGTSRTITFEADVAGAGVFSGDSVTTLANTANVRSDQVSTRQDTADVNVSVVAGIQFVQSKSAFNLTQGVDATTSPASPGDIITYTLRVKNTGQTTITNFRIEDDISDILELATITNQGGAESVNGIIRWAPVDIPPGVEIVKTFQVRVKDAEQIPASSDLVMTNVFGNVVKIPVRLVRGVTKPPVTGMAAGEWLSVATATLITAGYAVYRRRPALPDLQRNS